MIAVSLLLFSAQQTLFILGFGCYFKQKLPAEKRRWFVYTQLPWECFLSESMVCSQYGAWLIQCVSDISMFRHIQGLNVLFCAHFKVYIYILYIYIHTLYIFINQELFKMHLNDRKTEDGICRQRIHILWFTGAKQQPGQCAAWSREPNPGLPHESSLMGSGARARC